MTTNKHSLSEACKECDSLGDQTWKRKVISPEPGNFAVYCIINIVLLYESHILKPLT